MPEKDKPLLKFIIFFAWLCIFFYTPFQSTANEGIEAYYLRYDVMTSSNKIVKDNLMMVPSEDDFRAADFSWIKTSDAIFADPNDSKQVIEKKIKENAIKSVLVKHGLKSVKTKDYDTVVSYEGIIMGSLQIENYHFLADMKTVTYNAEIKFAPISFPSDWEWLSFKKKVGNMFKDFWDLFK